MAGEKCHITGWGFTSRTGQQFSPQLLQATIPIHNFEECQQIEPWYKRLSKKMHMCAGDKLQGWVNSSGFKITR
jgi:hypothetical protein